MLEQIKVLKYYFYYKYCLSLGGRKALMRRQAWRMRRHLRYVAKYSEIYRGKRRLRDYPIVDKEFMMSHFQELNTVGIGKEEAEEFARTGEKFCAEAAGSYSGIKFRNIRKTRNFFSIR